LPAWRSTRRCGVREYGEQLLLDALGKAVAASEIGGGRLIVVDAIDDEATILLRALPLRFPSPTASGVWS